MAASEDLINFDIIEGHKENIQALPSGRSAKKLADLFAPSPLHKQPTSTPSDTKSINDLQRAEFEAEIANISESDDPLDVYDRYVRWTFDAYPSAQATPASQLHTLLERATRAFVSAAQYKNDPRYLKLWLHYIHFFSDAPRETYVYLSRHGVGEGLALFYEEYAAWLEGAGRWAQAEEVYKLGIEREALPQQRLIRKFGEFEQRRAQQPEAERDAPSSPALPSVRPALAAKIDPFAAAAGAARDPQAPRQHSGVGGQSSKPGRSKLQIFSDADTAAAAPAMASGAGSKGWESIGSLADRKKENVMEPKPWAGETLKAGGAKSSAPKMAVFRDPNQVTVNPHTGKKERVFVDLEAVYPNPEVPGTELSFEEIWAANRGWLDQVWEDDVLQDDLVEEQENRPSDMDILSEAVSEKLVVHHDVVMLDENGQIQENPRAGKSKKKKVIEYNETQIIKAKLDSPTGPKIKKRNASEPTMTMHTKAATDDIYEIFNAPLKQAPQEEEETADEEDYETDGDYTSGAESTGTTRQIGTSSDAGDEEVEEPVDGDEETSDVKSVSEWSDFSTRKHVPDLAEEDDGDDTRASDLIDARDSEPSEHLSERETEGGDEEQEEDAEEASTPELPPLTRTSFIPIPPEDYVPPRRPYRDPVEMANNRLPFMTPITERTESSLTMGSDENDAGAKTPSKKDVSSSAARESLNLEPLSSPLREVVNDASPQRKIAQPLLQKTKAAVAKAAATIAKPAPRKGPIIKDLQCNPVDESIRTEILANIQPPLSSYEGFYDHRDEKYEKGGEIRKYVKAYSKAGRNSTDKTSSVPSPVVIDFADTTRQYILKKELGAGAFAPVYLVENCSPDDNGDADDEAPVAVMGKGAFAVAQNRRSSLEAVKMEDPPTPWEFHMMRLAHARLGPQHRATASLSAALEMHLYRDEGFLFLPYHPHGTLLDVVNLFRAEPSGVMDETLAMFFTVELLRTVEALHARQVLHGDLKADNCILRLDPFPAAAGGIQGGELSSQWRADGGGNWASRGVTLIDFGRAIDMRAFAPEAQFIADWRTSAQDCAEMREGRPWTWQVDYHGLAGVVHCLLFGKYIETARCDAGGLLPGSAAAGSRRYRLRESLKRYWQTEIWAECFEVLLNPGAAAAEAEEGGRMPVLRSMRRVRERMEGWLEANCERGVGLKSLMAKVEAAARSRR
ncbi:Checkpoint serine/threonine-protein kinase bub1 [Pleurostoma richardsiae]|uniref:Checkpoint serine/threonine-protein kinase bub1 n=1 Tax=Pleurostoma richardsiae TaxID=41990 RepID=A0AA38RUB0_9PEZI|nr:Checkpoint serine/threonine-protein kinase bub1 [Pleurostoma richardsiae]